MSVKAFIKILREIDPGKDGYTKFRDFLTMASCALDKKTAEPTWAEALEEQYMQVVRSYRKKDDVRRMPELLAMVFDKAGQRSDFLGNVAGELGLQEGAIGQFFTPYEVCRLIAEINCGDLEQKLERKGFITLQEPACGAGAMVLAIAGVIEGKCHDQASCLRIEAIDIAEIPYRMCFLQLACRGLSGRVWRGNTLSMEMFESFT
ncbi:N-6 DNA methylase [Pelagibius sp. Alg239-R121]|uniref:N-6 DNA methylase n=1 Tax=Pelagibius sp. Alg239-R121 TaxID=2993448 RepID=UPI0024A63A0F|nr:N-6 DNA methylase [Pelagibius sp. Alg239-R121]